MQTATRTIVEKYSQIGAGDFRNRLDQSWTALEQLKEQVSDLVESQNLTPVEGVGIIGCVAAQMFGYQAFHGQATPADLYSTLSNPPQRV